MYDVVFLATATGKVYEDFLAPFTLFTLVHTPNSFIEIIVEDKAEFEKKYETQMTAVAEIVGTSQFLVRNFQHEFNHHHPSVYRYFEVPEVRGKYTYIIDVDIMLLEDILPHYLANWPDPSLPYNNAIRKRDKRLTGVHFMETEKYFTPKLLQRQQELYREKNYRYGGPGNERHLYDLCATAHGLVDKSFRWRPLFGIHFSPHRGRSKKAKLECSPEYRDQFFALADKYPHLFEYRVFDRLKELMLLEFRVTEGFEERRI